MASLSNSTNIHRVDFSNKALNNSIHGKCSSETKILIETVVCLTKKLVINKKMEKFLF